MEIDAEAKLLELQQELRQHTYRPGRSICFVTDGPTPREVSAADFRDRIVHHLLVHHLERAFEPRFIHDSYACRRGKGTLAASDRVMAFLRWVTANGHPPAVLAIQKVWFIIARMVPRYLQVPVLTALHNYPVVALLGPRQVGKTTLALALARQLPQPTVHLDLERDSDLNRLANAELYLGQQAGKLVIIDEVQRRPQLFPLLRSVVDARIRHGERAGHFLVLGSASRDLLQQSSESLAGRIAYLELKPFSLVELAAYEATFDLDRLWLRGGFPNSYLAASDQLSLDWRSNFISTYLERDIPQLGPRLPAVQMRRLWTMLAHGQGAQLNVARLAASLGVSGHSVRHYLDVLTDLYMVRQLPPWLRNPKKRLVKSPKVYVRDSGLMHRLVNIPDLDTLLGHPVCGDSWEGFAIESLLMHMPDSWEATYYRTSAQAEIDLVLEGPGGRVTAIEVKRTLMPAVSKGFRLSCDDIGAAAGGRFYCIPTGERYPIGHGTDAIALRDLVDLLMAQWYPA